MNWTGNVGRTFGQVLLALGIISLVLGILGLVFGGLVLRDSVADAQGPDGDVGDVLEALVLGGMALSAAGTAAVVLAIVVLGFARALRDRHQRRLAAAPSASPAPAP